MMDILLDNFRQLTTTPKNVDQLRKLVLQLAVQGKLTEEWRKQNPDVEPASALLERIRDEKERLIKEKKIKRQKPLPEITEEEKPFDLPEGWEWCRLGNLAKGFQYGTSTKSSKIGEVPVLRMGNIQNGFISWDDLVYSSDENEIDKFLLSPNDLLFNRTNSRELVGKTALFCSSQKAIYAGYLIRFQMLGKIVADYANYVMNSSLHREWCDEVKTDAIGQSNINATKLQNFRFPLPFLPEQKAIVKKVESLFAKIDRLHELAQKKAETRQNVAKAMFGGMNTATNEDDLQSTWQLLKNNFAQVSQTKEGIKQLRQSILQLAVQGRLTAEWRRQNPDVEPASKLLERIRAEKEQLIKEKKIKCQKPFPEITEKEKPFDLPEGWEWCRLSDIADIIMGQSPPSETYNEIGDGLPFYQGKKEFGKIYPRGVTVWCSDPKRIAEENDILISVRAPVGDVNIAKELYAIGRGLSIIRLIEEGSLFFIFNYLDCFRKNWTTKGSFFDSINKNHVLSLIIPYPSFSEQNAIVKKVNRLMSWCDELEKKAEERKTLHEKIMQAVVRQAI